MKVEWSLLFDSFLDIELQGVQGAPSLLALQKPSRNICSAKLLGWEPKLFPCLLLLEY